LNWQQINLQTAVNTIAGLRTTQSLHDPTDHLATLQPQAHTR
jgi:hypothetical protein